MKHTVWEAVEAIDPSILEDHLAQKERLYQKRRISRMRQWGALAAVLLLAVATFIFARAITDHASPYAFMDYNGFYEVGNAADTVSPAFRHDSDRITVDVTQNLPISADIPEQVTVNGKTLDLGACLEQKGASLVYGLATESDPSWGGLVPVDNIPTVTIDATSGKITGFDHIVLDTTPGLGKSLDDYILSAKYAISTYMPYLDTASLVVKNAASMAEHSSAYAYGFILFDYYVEDIRTAMRVSVFFYGGKIISIGVYDFFDLSALDKASLAFDAKAHTAMLTSFADYACGDMEKLSSTVSEGVLVMGARGEYAISYEVTVTARDAEQREYSHTFTLEIELDCS